MGVIKTLESVKRYFWWNGMDDSVRDYIGSCPSCQRNKASTQRPMGLLQPLPIPEKRWDSVSLDFTFGLPVTPDGYDGILVFVDRLSKMMHCAPCKSTITGAESAKLYLQTVFKYHGMCKELVSDRDPRFTGQFWQSLFRALGTKLNMSTARQPQTDGQTERMIRTLKEMLRSYVSEQKNNWAEMLPYVEFAYNDSVQASTGHTPFFLNAGDHPNRPTSLLSHADTARAPAALDLLAELRTALAQARENIKSAQQRQQQDANRSRRDATFKVGDKVLISTDNVRLPAGPARTFDAKQDGPYEITAVPSSVTVKLRVPHGRKFHPVFHISQLKRYNDGRDSAFPGRVAPPTPPPLHYTEDLWEVERCLKKEMRKGTPWVLVKWKDFDDKDSSWEPIGQLNEAARREADQLPLSEPSTQLLEPPPPKQPKKKRGQRRTAAAPAPATQPAPAPVPAAPAATAGPPLQPEAAPGGLRRSQRQRKTKMS